jgi:anaerobic ribonucleoside-triphosphate reductase activating protein
VKKPADLQEILARHALLNVSELLIGSRGNGPGERAVIWLQGCTLHCPGCINQKFLDFKPRYIVHPPDLLCQILCARQDLEGITVTGGEPFDQPDGLSILLCLAQQQGLSTLVYTGYTLDYLRSRQEELYETILKSVDILIDGPFVAAQRGDFLGRGSANQRILYLSSRYDPYLLGTPVDWFNEEIILYGDDQAIRTGIIEVVSTQD